MTGQTLFGRRDLLRALGMAFLTSVVLTSGAGWGVPGAKSVVGALRVLDGDIPYRDFWSMYAPGQFYAVAGLYWLFGRELWVQGIAAVLLNGAASGLFFLLLRSAGASLRLAWLGAGLWALSLWETAPEFGSYGPARPLLLVALILIFDYWRNGGANRLVGAGVACGAAAWFKHDVGAYAAVGMGAALVISWFSAGDRRPRVWIQPWRAAALLLLGASAAVAPVILAVAWSAGIDAWRDLILFPATDFRGVRGEPYPGLIPPLSEVVNWLSDPGDLRLGQRASTGLSVWVLGNLPQLVFAAGVVVLVRARRTLDPSSLGGLIVCLTCLPFYWMASHVQQNTHPLTMAILCAPPLVIAWSRFASGSRLRRAAIAGSAGLLAAGLLIPPAGRARLLWTQWPDHRVLELPGVRGIRMAAKQHDTYLPIAEFVRGHVPEDEPIYVGVWRHDAIVITDLRLILFAGRRTATRYDELHPAVTDRPEVQQEMIESIETARVRCVVLWKFGWPDERLDRIKMGYMAAVPGLGSTLLDEFLRDTFEPVAEFGQYVILWRKGIPLPHDAEDREM